MERNGHVRFINFIALNCVHLISVFNFVELGSLYFLPAIISILHKNLGDVFVILRMVIIDV